MAEVVEIADRVTVLRDGAVALSCPMAETSKDGIIAAMTGQAWRTPIRRPAGTAPGQEVVLEVDNLSVGPVRDVGFQLRRGEILGIAGLEGAGQSEILRALLGDLRPEAGRIRLGGEPAPRSAAEGWARGIAYVPRERRREGLMLGRGIAPNVVLPHLARLSRWGLWSRGRRRTAEAEAQGRRGAPEIRPAGAERGDAVGRKPAEGGLCPRRGGNAASGACWMSRRAASMWARGPISTR
jgi:ribose transport system ATP-binding protein